MRSILFSFLGFLLFPLFAAGEPIEWGSMEKPYFVYNASGITVGWDESVQHTYMIASDLNTNVLVGSKYQYRHYDFDFILDNGMTIRKLWTGFIHGVI